MTAAIVLNFVAFNNKEIYEQVYNGLRFSIPRVHRSRVTKFFSSLRLKKLKYSRPRLGDPVSTLGARRRLSIPQVHRLAQDMNLLIQNRGVLFCPNGLIKHLAFFGCLSHFCLQVANKNMLRVFDSPPSVRRHTGFVGYKLLGVLG